MILAMAAFLTYLKPAIGLKASDLVVDLHRHSGRIVPFRGGWLRLIERVLARGPALCLPERPTMERAEVLRPLP
jgi:hypothetical protein